MQHLLRPMIALAAGLGVAGAPAAAVTFAQFFQQAHGTPVQYAGGSGGATLTATFEAIVTVLDYGPPGVVLATATISASTTGAIVDTGATFLQEGWSGTISFTNGAPNLLTTTFSDGVLKVTPGPSQSGNLRVVGGCPGILCYTSDVLDVGGLTINNFALSFSDIQPVGGTARFGLGGGNYVASVTGTFAGQVPEPATWALLIAGFGLVGLAARHRRTSIRLVA
ncbi:MAG: PEPxxWA-CTERM sorting domain-containing protein [Sphingomonadaceae bacterium]